MLRDLREIMGLSVNQVADELSLSGEDISRLEQTEDASYAGRFINAFPINRKILVNPDADPFLPSYDQTSPGQRLGRWMLENRISASEIASALGVDLSSVISFIQESNILITKAYGESIEQHIGINRKWLMYGDGRRKGKPISTLANNSGNTAEDKKSLLEMMAADFKKLPDNHIKTAAEIKAERKREGQRVRDARKEAHLSLKDVAEILNLSASRIGQIECGIVTPNKADEVIKSIKDYIALKNDENKPETDSGMDGKTTSNDGDLEVVPASPETYTDRRILGHQVREARKMAQLSLKQASELLSISKGRICQMESGIITEKRASEVLYYYNQYSDQKSLSAKNYEFTGKTEDTIESASNIQLGLKIKHLRNKAGLSQKRVGNMLGVSQSTISFIEKGMVTEEKADRIIKLLESNGVMTTDLL